MPLPDNLKPFFMLTDDGALLPLKGATVPIRQGYAYHHTAIKNGAQLRATLRAGAYTWPGGYPLALLAADGDALCFKCARAEFKTIARAMRYNLADPWSVTGCFINWEDPHLSCAHCGGTIPSAYGNDEDE